MSTTSRVSRAAPLSPEDRRSAILEAVGPLVRDRGAEVTTRELAAAAGVAEGTLFRVFPDKSSLVAAALAEGLREAARSDESIRELAAIDRSLPLEERIRRVIEIGQQRMGEIVRWMSVLRSSQRSDADREQWHARHGDLRAQSERQRAATTAAVRAVLAPDAHRLRVGTDVAVRLIESAIVGTQMPVGLPQATVSAAEIADVLVHGLVHDASAP